MPFRALSHKETVNLAQDVLEHHDWQQAMILARKLYGPDAYRVVITPNRNHLNECDALPNEITVADQSLRTLLPDTTLPYWQTNPCDDPLAAAAETFYDLLGPRHATYIADRPPPLPFPVLYVADEETAQPPPI